MSLGRGPIGVVLAAALAIAPGAASARGGDDASVDGTVAEAQVSAATASVAADLSAAQQAVAAPAAAPEVAAIAAIQTARDGSRECLRKYRPENIGDFSEADLDNLQLCIARAFSALAEEMLALKAFQNSALFDFGLFAETARLLADKSNPGAETLAPVAAMLEAAMGAAESQERVAAALLADLTAEARAALTR